MPDVLDYKDLPPEAHEAVHAARNAAQKVEVARELQTTRAADAAADRVSQNIGDILQNRIEHVLARGTEQEKSIILARVPYICQDIKGINKALSDIVKMMEKNRSDREASEKEREKEYNQKYVNQDQFSPVQKVVYGAVALFLTGIGSALLYLVLKGY